MTRTAIFDNVVAAPDDDNPGYAGGIRLLNTDATITDCQIYNNTATAWGGGLAIESNYDKVVTIDRCSIHWPRRLRTMSPRTCPCFRLGLRPDSAT